MNEVSAYEGMSPIEKLNFFRNKYHADGSSTEFGIIADAINELLPKLVKMDSLAAMDYVEKYGPIKQKNVAVFDRRRVSEDEVLDAIKAGGYHQDVITMSERQYESVFRKGPND